VQQQQYGRTDSIKSVLESASAVSITNAVVAYLEVNAAVMQQEELHNCVHLNTLWNSLASSCFDSY
jgi:hypothetical protein